MSLNILQNVNLLVQQITIFGQEFIEDILVKHSLERVYLALAIILLTTLILIIIRSRRSGDTVLLVGLTDAGKTLLYSWLVAKKFMTTQTSIKENKGMYQSEGRSKKSWNLVDLPGHERVRSKYMYKHKDSARGIVFLIDSVKFPKEIRDVAELMYDLLANRTMQKNKAAILVACNKQDQPTAKSCNVIKTQLEKEMTNLRRTRSAALLGTNDSSSSKNAFIGKQGKDFEFTHVRPIKVEFCECSLKADECNETNQIEELESWLRKL